MGGGASVARPKAGRVPSISGTPPAGSPGRVKDGKRNSKTSGIQPPQRVSIVYDEDEGDGAGLLGFLSRHAKQERLLAAVEYKCSRKHLTSVPPEVQKIINLEVLDLSWNLLESIPTSVFKRLKKLSTLSIACNEFKCLPEGITLVADTLTELDAQSNQIYFLPEKFATMKVLARLNLAGNKIAEFPRELRDFRCLEVLDLSNNKLTRIGKVLSGLPNLQILSLAKNQIQDIPIAVTTLSKLKVLDLGSNKINALPVELSDCTSLEVLSLQMNELAVLPWQLSQCTQLRILDLGNNAIQIIPQEFCFITTLVELRLNDNKLMALKGRVGMWLNLQVLDLAGNSLAEVPAEIGRLPFLREFDISRNDNFRIPPQVTKNGTRAVITYLHSVGEQHNLIDKQLDKLAKGLNVEGNLEGHQHLPSLSQNNQRPSSDSQQSRPSAAGQQQVSEKSAAHAERRETTKSFLSSNAKLHRLTAPMKEKQKEFKESVEQTRKLLAMKEMSLGNTIVNRMRRAEQSGVLDLKASDLRAIPPEVGMIRKLRVIDLKDNSVEELTEAVVCQTALQVLNMPRNKLRIVSSRWSLPELRILCLSFNMLKELEPNIGSASPKLKILFLGNNFLETLPPSFAQLQLVELFLSENQFEGFPSVILAMRDLKRLSMACNQLSGIPSAISHLRNLVLLDLSFNEITSLPMELLFLNNLIWLNLSYNPFGGVFPSVITEMTNLQELGLDACQLTDVPVEIENLKKLRVLRLGENPLKPFLAQIYKKEPLLVIYFHDTSIEELDLSDADISELPPTISRLTSLQHLDLRGNHLRVLPMEIGGLTALQSLDLDDNPLEAPFSTILETNDEIALVELLSGTATEIDLSESKLESVPDLILKKGASLHVLNLASNKLQELPMAMQIMKSLQCLVIDNNNFKHLPAVITCLTTLQVLEFSDNMITDIPANIRYLTDLRQLVLGANKVKKLPPPVFDLFNLLTLAAPENRIREIPEELGQLINLVALDMRGNDIEVLPPSIKNLKKLRFLDMRVNSLAQLPAELGECVSLRDLNLSNNCIVTLPPTIANLTNLTCLRAAANQIQSLPLEVCMMVALVDLQFYGNPLPPVSVPLNAVGPTDVKLLLVELAVHFEQRAIVMQQEVEELRVARLAALQNQALFEMHDNKGEPVVMGSPHSGPEVEPPPPPPPDESGKTSSRPQLKKSKTRGSSSRKPSLKSSLSLGSSIRSPSAASEAEAMDSDNSHNNSERMSALRQLLDPKETPSASLPGSRPASRPRSGSKVMFEGSTQGVEESDGKRESGKAIVVGGDPPERRGEDVETNGPGGVLAMVNERRNLKAPTTPEAERTEVKEKYEELKMLMREDKENEGERQKGEDKVGGKEGKESSPEAASREMLQLSKDIKSDSRGVDLQPVAGTETISNSKNSGPGSETDKGLQPAEVQADAMRIETASSATLVPGQQQLSPSADMALTAQGLLPEDSLATGLELPAIPPDFRFSKMFPQMGLLSPEQMALLGNLPPGSTEANLLFEQMGGLQGVPFDPSLIGLLPDGSLDQSMQQQQLGNAFVMGGQVGEGYDPVQDSGGFQGGSPLAYPAADFSALGYDMQQVMMSQQEGMPNFGSGLPLHQLSPQPHLGMPQPNMTEPNFAQQMTATQTLLAQQQSGQP